MREGIGELDAGRVRHACLRYDGIDVANPWPPDEQAQFIGLITAALLNKAYSVVVNLCAPLTPVARDMMDDGS